MSSEQNSTFSKAGHQNQDCKQYTISMFIIQSRSEEGKCDPNPVNRNRPKHDRNDEIIS